MIPCAVADELDVFDAHRERVARLRAVDVDGPGQRVADAEVELRERVARLEAVVAERVLGLDHDPRPRPDSNGRVVGVVVGEHAPAAGNPGGGLALLHAVSSLLLGDAAGTTNVVR